jgi:hypothetical protein
MSNIFYILFFHRAPGAPSIHSLIVDGWENTNPIIGKKEAGFSLVKKPEEGSKT